MSDGTVPADELITRIDPRDDVADGFAGLAGPVSEPRARRRPGPVEARAP